MSRQFDDSPYRDDTPAHAAASRDTARRSRSTRRQHASRGPAHPAPAAPPPGPPSTRKPRRDQHDAASAASPRRRSARRGRGRGANATAAAPRLTSHPTTRAAYVETRVWLLEQHGPVCAYCGRRFTPGVMTLDHVAPRRGQKAYDRRDNLVLACPGCNAAKRDLAPLAFLLAVRSRAANLLRYGAHLSPMLLDLARSLAPAGALPAAEETAVAAEPEREAWAWLDSPDDGESPYRD